MVSPWSLNVPYKIFLFPPILSIRWSWGDISGTIKVSTKKHLWKGPMVPQGHHVHHDSTWLPLSKPIISSWGIFTWKHNNGLVGCLTICWPLLAGLCCPRFVRISATYLSFRWTSPQYRCLSLKRISLTGCCPFTILESPTMAIRDPFYKHCLILIPAWISNHMPSKVWVRVLIQSQIPKVARLSLEWTSNFISNIIMVEIAYPCWN